ncbi:hypothetical protein DVH24_038969 [Malus domestica]|uniref:RBR-type E3 ubiquitin transferase n=1 Tax=Malus domestica TaxID=3750 RepID=A0A498KG07_MALDO|nr:hypothetical protein DVH24_038969 [Malus domestica]
MSVKETCLICFEDNDVARMLSIGTCQHKYCLPCLKHHVEINLQNGIVAQCPHKDCKCEVNVDSCKTFLSSELANVLIERIKESSIPVTEKVYCPFPRCSALMSKQEVLENTKTSFVSEGGRKCVKCKHYFCINCKVPWHYDMSCYDFQRSEMYSCVEDQLLKSFASKKLWRQCSKCNHMVELESGQYVNIAGKVILFYMLSQDLDTNAIFSCKDISTFLRRKLRKGFTHADISFAILVEPNGRTSMQPVPALSGTSILLSGRDKECDMTLYVNKHM